MIYGMAIWVNLLRESYLIVTTSDPTVKTIEMYRSTGTPNEQTAWVILSLKQLWSMLGPMCELLFTTNVF